MWYVRKFLCENLNLSVSITLRTFDRMP